MNKKQFDGCIHNWKFHIDVDSCGGPASGNSVYICEKCMHLITLKEKAALDSVESTRESLKNQERSLKNAKIATYVAAGALCLTAIIFICELYVNKI